MGVPSVVKDCCSVWVSPGTFSKVLCEHVQDVCCVGLKVVSEVVCSIVKCIGEQCHGSELVGSLYVAVAKEACVYVGEEFWWEVELSAECFACDFAVVVMLDGILSCVAAAKKASVGVEVSFLVSPVSAPSVPQGADRSSCDPGWGESPEEL